MSFGPGVLVVFQSENISVGLGVTTFGQPQCQQSPVIQCFLVSGFRFTEVPFGNGRLITSLDAGNENCPCNTW